DQDYAVPTREYQTDQSSPILLRLLLPCPRKNKSKSMNNPTPVQALTGHSISVPGWGGPDAREGPWESKGWAVDA
ncbi:MAG: hypothetical protein ACP5E5_00005, partial [Acidobacteriaceae bacterium]